MPHGKLLSDYEKGQINAFITCEKKKLQIAKLLDRSPTVISRARFLCKKPLNSAKNLYKFFEAVLRKKNWIFPHMQH